jgi:hypothetical protein
MGMADLTRDQIRRIAEIQYQMELHDKEGGLAPELSDEREWVRWRIAEIERRGAAPWEIALIDKRPSLVSRICATVLRALGIQSG